MSISIPLSVIGNAAAFQSALETHCDTLTAHAAGPASVPAPVSCQPLLDALVMRVPRGDPLPDAFQIAPYEVFDDSPPPPSLEERKSVLLRALQDAATATINAILSPARAKVLELDAIDAMTEAGALRIGRAQSAAIEANNAFQLRCNEITRNAAVAAVEIEDLTEETIGAWKVPSL